MLDWIRDAPFFFFFFFFWAVSSTTALVRSQQQLSNTAILRVRLLTTCWLCFSMWFDFFPSDRIDCSRRAMHVRSSGPLFPSLMIFPGAGGPFSSPPGFPPT